MGDRLARHRKGILLTGLVVTTIGVAVAFGAPWDMYLSGGVVAGSLAQRIMVRRALRRGSRTPAP